MTHATNPYEEVIDPTRLCFYCPAPAVVEHEAEISSAYPDGTSIVDLARGAIEPTRSALRISGTACAEHADALADSLMETFDVAVGGQSLTRSTCPDPWHEGGDAYDASATEEESIGNGWYSSHFVCPTCGFSTSVRKAMTSRDDPAYRYVVEAIHGSAGSL